MKSLYACIFAMLAGIAAMPAAGQNRSNLQGLTAFNQVDYQLAAALFTDACRSGDDAGCAFHAIPPAE